MAAAACVLVPVYREVPEQFELLSMQQLVLKLGEREIRIVAPEGLSATHYLDILGDRPVHYFDRRFFASRETYNALMVYEPLYRVADGFQFVLVHQTDAFVFEDHLDHWTAATSFDYIGAPFVGAAKTILREGANGGFSLRNVDAFLRVLTRRNSLMFALPRSKERSLRRVRRGEMMEDNYWGSVVRVASLDERIDFAFESGLETLGARYAAKPPFGCHRVWNLEYIDAIRHGVMPGREPLYENALATILERTEANRIRATARERDLWPTQIE
jgi:hypothetical protein